MQQELCTYEQVLPLVQLTIGLCTPLNREFLSNVRSRTARQSRLTAPQVNFFGPVLEVIASVVVIEDTSQQVVGWITKSLFPAFAVCDALFHGTNRMQEHVRRLSETALLLVSAFLLHVAKGLPPVALRAFANDLRAFPVRNLVSLI